MKRILALVVLFAPALPAQTISPIISEYGRNAKGSFTVANSSVQPMVVTVSINSFNLDPSNGKSIYRPLDTSTRVSLSEMSARVGPKQQHQFFYRVQCETLPCQVVFFAGMIVGRTPSGIGVRIVLPHVVYTCESQKNCRANIRRASGLAD